MTVPTNTIQNVNRVGVREDLSNKIAELFPDDTPFLNAIGTGKCSATKTEWQTDGLAAATPANPAWAATGAAGPPCALAGRPSGGGGSVMGCRVQRPRRRCRRIAPDHALGAGHDQ